MAILFPAIWRWSRSIDPTVNQISAKLDAFLGMKNGFFLCFFVFYLRLLDIILYKIHVLQLFSKSYTHTYKDLFKVNSFVNKSFLEPRKYSLANMILFVNSHWNTGRIPGPRTLGRMRVTKCTLFSVLPKKSLIKLSSVFTNLEETS